MQLIIVCIKYIVHIYLIHMSSLLSFDQYVLSSGKDSIVKLWELSMSRCLIAYTGAGATGKQVHRAQGIFNHTEDYGEHTASLQQPV